jgi:hypothetical protein
MRPKKESYSAVSPSSVANNTNDDVWTTGNTKTPDHVLICVHCSGHDGVVVEQTDIPVLLPYYQKV